MAQTNVFDVDAFLDRRRLGLVHVRIIGLILLAMMIDGYDILMVGWTLPPIAKSMHVAPQALTDVFVAQQLALFLGTLVVGPLSDRFGRRPVLLTCIAGFTVLTLATAGVTTPGQLVALRFASALFCSAVIPLACAMASEAAPSRLRASVVTLVFCGYTGGHFIGAFVQAFMLEQYGWRSAFWVGGLLGVGVLAVLFLLLPESVRFRVQRDGADPRIARALRTFEPGLSLRGDERFVLSEPAPAGAKAPMTALFREGRAIPTFLLWIGFLCAFAVLHIMGSWSTTVLHNQAGLSFKSLASMSAISTAFGIVGMMTTGLMMDRFGASRVMPILFLGAAASTGAFGLIDLRSPMFYVVGAISGYFSNSELGALSALGSILYPARIRATGLSWGAGAGRVGGMLGPVFGGFMLAEHWPITTIYLVTGAPLLISAIAVLAMAPWTAGLRRRGPIRPTLGEARGLPTEPAGSAP